MNCTQYLDMLRTARMQARIASALYRSRHDVMKVASEAGGRLYWVQVAFARAAAVVFDDHAHLVVCGTNDAHDWIQNLSARQVDVGGFLMHGGFARTAGWLKRELLKRTVLEAIDGRPIVLGGHSAGGAVAQLLSQDPDLRPREMITFGAPRVFDPGSAASYAAYPWEIRRFVMSGDPVPCLPLRKFRCLFSRAAYAHDSPALHLGDSGEVLMDQNASAVRKIASLAASAWLFGSTSLAMACGEFSTLLKNHSMDRYEAAISKAIDEVSE